MSNNVAKTPVNMGSGNTSNMSYYIGAAILLFLVIGVVIYFVESDKTAVTEKLPKTTKDDKPPGPGPTPPPPGAYSSDPHRCACTNGVPVDPSDCPKDGAQACKSCDTGYDINNSTISKASGPTCSVKKSICSCPNGTPATTGCTTVGQVKCASCNSGFGLVGGKCVAQCGKQNGTCQGVVNVGEGSPHNSSSTCCRNKGDKPPSQPYWCCGHGCGGNSFWNGPQTCA